MMVNTSDDDDDNNDDDDDEEHLYNSQVCEIFMKTLDV